MQSKERFVVISILVLGIIVAMTLARGFEWICVAAGINDPYIFGMRQLPLTALIAYLVSLGAVVFCLKNQNIRTLSNEVVDELSKVTWPTREETGQATIVVVVTVLICAAFLGLFDSVWLWLTDRLLGLGGVSEG